MFFKTEKYKRKFEYSTRMEQDNYAKFVGNLFIEASKVAVVTALLYVGAKNTINNYVLQGQQNDTTQSDQKPYFMASRGSQEISDIINYGFDNSSKLRK